MRQFRICVIAASMSFVVGCQSDTNRDAASEKPLEGNFHCCPVEGLREAATTLWTARIDRDFATIYRFQPDSYRSSVDLESFVRTGAEDLLFRYLTMELGDVEIADNVGWVELRTQTALARFADIPARSISRRETWICEAGRWRPCTPEESNGLPQAPSLRSADAESALRERFLAYGRARVAGDHKALYECISPADRLRLPFAEFAESEAVLRILAAEPDWVEVIGDVGRVRVSYLVASADPSLSKLNPRCVQVTEQWREEEATWFRVVPM